MVYYVCVTLRWKMCSIKGINKLLLGGNKNVPQYLLTLGYS